ncbi:MAG: hypothetical protein H3C30_11125 [Candidatus Hydrogenedentes bacterium]|nr:hypothetical protein [Candidatus Hydrogenedentota bacterium]
MMKRGVCMLTACLLLAVVAGCATAAKKSPEDLIKEQLMGWKAAMEAQDVDKIMANFSDNFKHYDWKDKAGAKDFIADAKDMGYLEGIEVLLDDMEIKVEGDKATVYPIDISGAFGSLSMELSLAKEGDTWMVVGLDAAGL